MKIKVSLIIAKIIQEGILGALFSRNSGWETLSVKGLEWEVWANTIEKVRENGY